MEIVIDCAWVDGSGGPRIVQAGVLPMICPQCKARVPAKALWTPSGPGRVVCPECGARLCPKAACAVALFLISLGLGEIALVALRSSGAGLEYGFLGFFLVFACAYCLAMPLVVKLRYRDDAVPLPSRSPAPPTAKTGAVR